MQMSRKDIQRYEKQIRLAEIGEAGQHKLARARVLVIGAGGLGCPALLYLAAAGIGKLGIVDGDTIDLSNLPRQVLFNEQQVGQSKAAVAAQVLAQQNPGIRLECFSQYLDALLALELFKDYDLVVDCTDNFATRYLVNDVCVLFNIPFVSGSIYKNQAQISVFNSQLFGARSLTYRDVYPEDQANAFVPDCNTTGVVGMLAGIAGLHQATEVMKYFVSPGKSLFNKTLVIDPWQVENVCIDLSALRRSDIRFTADEIKRHNYAIPCKSSVYTAIDAEALEQLLNKQNPVTVVDVRNYNEGDPFSGAPVLKIPLGELGARIAELAHYDQLVLICQSGKRSAQACSIISASFPEKKLWNLKGGMSACSALKE